MKFGIFLMALGLTALLSAYLTYQLGGVGFPISIGFGMAMSGFVFLSDDLSVGKK